MALRIFVGSGSVPALARRGAAVPPAVVRGVGALRQNAWPFGALLPALPPVSGAPGGMTSRSYASLLPAAQGQPVSGAAVGSSARSLLSSSSLLLPRRRFSLLSDAWRLLARRVAPPTPEAPSAPTVLVQVGSGEYSSFAVRVDQLRLMGRSAFLQALAQSPMFATELKAVPLDDCKVYVLQSVAGQLPLAVEEAAANVRELAGAGTLGELLPPSAGTLFIRVRLPSPLDASLGECGAQSCAPSSTRAHLQFRRRCIALCDR